MRFALVVCGVLVVLLLAPIDGRLKYAEVLPGGSLESFLRRPLQAASSHGGEVSSGTLPVASDPIEAPSTKKREERESDAMFGAEVEVEPDPMDEMGEPGEQAPLACFPPTDLLYKYDWARHDLRHPAEKPWSKESTQHAPEDSNGFSGEDGSDREGRMSMRSSTKRSDYNRELSADLYAQYTSSCACQTKYELRDLGYTHFPRYIVNAICQNRSASSRKCWRGSSCKEIPYKVRVLTRRSDAESGEQDHHSALLPEPLREYWRFKTVTVAAACQCSV